MAKRAQVACLNLFLCSIYKIPSRLNSQAGGYGLICTETLFCFCFFFFAVALFKQRTNAF